MLLALALHAQTPDNLWPLSVEHEASDLGRPAHHLGLGPLFSAKHDGETRILSFRPLWTSFQEPQATNVHVLYPLLNGREQGGVQSAHALNLLQYRRNAAAGRTFFQAFPFLFYNDSPVAAERYAALWPLGGFLKNRFWRDEIRFAFWPLFVQTHKNDEVRTHMPYPFIQLLDGPKSRGFGLWPLFGTFSRDDDYDHTWALWPFFYSYKDDLDKPVPYTRFGVLPFYTKETGAGLKSETYLWPFFGYTREGAPRKTYAEHRYFWPLFVQGRGAERRVNRWMPFFTDERKGDYRKRWFLWPFLERETWAYPGLTRERTSLLYFLYRDEQQRFADTKARLSFLWPLYGYWHDGHDRKQFQMLDPFSVFFPKNRVVRENWTPLFALYRFDERAGNTRHSVLWDMLVWEREAGETRFFQAGPLFEWEAGSHWQVLRGLLGAREAGGSWKLSYFWRDE